MKRFFTVLFASLFLVPAMAAVCPDVADAARMGGGRSIGAPPSMSSPAKTPKQYARQAQPPPPQAGAAAQAGRSGLGFGGGLLGGLLAGSLIGGLLGGHGLAGGMGGLLDIILLVVVVMLIVSFVRKRRQAAAYQQASGPDPAQNYRNQYGQQQYQATGGSAWDSLRGDPQAGAGNVSFQSNIPAGFDVENFLKGAKMAYTRMQASWDKRDLEDISHFATEPIMTTLRQQMAEDPNPGRTQIVMLNATLVNVEEFGSQDRAQVYFDALLIEDPRQTQPANARELWTFVREHKSGNWKLDGLQQIEGC